MQCKLKPFKSHFYIHFAFNCICFILYGPSFSFKASTKQAKLSCSYKFSSVAITCLLFLKWRSPEANHLKKISEEKVWEISFFSNYELYTLVEKSKSYPATPVLISDPDTKLPQKLLGISYVNTFSTELWTQARSLNFHSSFSSFSIKISFYVSPFLHFISCCRHSFN